MQQAIVTQALSKRYKNQFAVQNLNLEVASGTVFGLLGPNGAGKSTTLGMLTALLKPTSGTAKVAGYSVQKQAAEIRKAIGIVFQEEMIDFDITARQNLDIHARLHHLSNKERANAVERALKISHLAERANDRVKNFSGGMRRRLEIARGLMHAPKVLFLDEPTLGLDIEARKEIWHEVQRLRERADITLILTTHYLEEADELCDVVAIIDKGSIKAQGKPSDLKSNLGGDVVRATLSNIDASFKQALHNVDGLSLIHLNDERVEFRIRRGEQRVPEIISLLEQHGSIKSFQLKAPSLDDVFLEATGHYIKEDATT